MNGALALALASIVAATAVLAVTGAPAAEAQAGVQVFHLAPDGVLSNQPTELREPLSAGVTACAVACVDSTTAYPHELRITRAGSVRPVHANLWIEVTTPTAFPPVPPSPAACPVTLFLDVYDSEGAWKDGWYYCVRLGTAGVVVEPGMYELDLAYSDFTPVPVVPGDWLHVSVWTVGTSTHGAPTMFISSDADHPASVHVAGTNEPMPEPPAAPAEGGPESSTEGPEESEEESATGTTTGTTTPAPTSAPTTAPPASTTPAGRSAPEESAPPLQGNAKGTPLPLVAAISGLLCAMLLRRR